MTRVVVSAEHHIGAQVISVMTSAPNDGWLMRVRDRMNTTSELLLTSEQVSEIARMLAGAVALSEGRQSS